MKKILFSGVFLFFPLFLFTQEKQPGDSTRTPKRFYLDISGGGSVPLGRSYPSFDKDKERAGYAATGYFVQANLSWLGKRDFGIAFQYTFQRNPLRDTAENIVPYGTKYQLGTGGWSNNYLLIGPVYLKSFNKFLLQTEAMIGVVFSFCTVFSDTDPVTGENHSNIGAGFGYSLRVGLGYNITPRLTIMANLNYLGGLPAISKEYQPQIIGYDSITNEQIYSALTEVKIKKTVSTFNAGIGLIYKF